MSRDPDQLTGVRGTEVLNTADGCLTTTYCLKRGNEEY